MARDRPGIIDPRGRSSQPLRALRVSVHTATARRPRTSVLYTSADQNEGNTTIAVNHAIVAAAAGQSVLVIDADSQHPDVHNRLGLAAAPGLVDYVVGDVDYEDLVRTATIGSVQLDVARVAGQDGPSSGDVLASPEMAELVTSAAESFDLVIIDAPSVLGNPDVNVLTALTEVDTVLVTRRGQRRKRVKQAIAQLERTRANLIGIVYNEG